MNRHQTAVDLAEKQAAEYGQAETDLREQSKKTSEAAAAAGIEHQRLAADAKTAHEAEQQLQVWFGRLAHHEGLVTLAEADQRIDVWGDAERLRHALTDAAAAAEAAALLIAVETAEDARILAGVDTCGLLPARTRSALPAATPRAPRS